MSLQTRLTDLVAAVGGDIKYLRNRVATSTGATQATRWVGATTGGAPTTGAHLVGDFVITTTGQVFVCSVAGTPGTWIENTIGGSSGGTPANMLTTDTAQLITGPKRLAGVTKGTEYVAGTATVNGGGAGQHHGALLIEPNTNLPDQTGLLLKAPSSTWGVGQEYSEGQVILYLDENNNVRYRVSRDGGIGTTGGLHVGLGQNGGSLAGATQAAWIDCSLAPNSVPIVLDAAAASTVDTLLARRGGVTQFSIDRWGNCFLGGAASIISVGNSTYLCNNAYFDGTNWRARKTDTCNIVGVSIFAPTNATFQSNGVVTAGAIITWILVDGTQGRMVFRKSAAQTVTGTTQTAVITSDSIASGSYFFQIDGTWTASTTAQGFRPSILVTMASGTVSAFNAQGYAYTAAGAMSSFAGATNGGAMNTASSIGTASGVYFPFQITGTFTTATLTSSLTVAFRVASSTTGSITIPIGPTLRLERLQ